MTKNSEAIAKVNHPPCVNLSRLETRNAPSMEKNIKAKPTERNVDFLETEKK